MKSWNDLVYIYVYIYISFYTLRLLIYIIQFNHCPVCKYFQPPRIFNPLTSIGGAILVSLIWFWFKCLQNSADQLYEYIEYWPLNMGTSLLWNLNSWNMYTTSLRLRRDANTQKLEDWPLKNLSFISHSCRLLTSI